MKKVLFLILAYTALLCSCKKYAEGPLISFRSSLNRIEGTWKVDKFYINDIDSTDLYYQKLGCKIKFTRDIFQDGSYIVQLFSCNNGKTLYGGWAFYHRDLDAPYNAIEFSGFPRDTSFNFIIGFKIACYDTIPNSIFGLYEIRRLTNRELILEVGGHSNNCGKFKRIELKKE